MTKSKFGYGYLIAIGNGLQSILLLITRLFLGWQFAISGWGKLGSLDSITEFFRGINIPFPEFNAPFVAGVEFIGGIMLFLGLGTRLASFFLSCTMIVALLVTHHDLWNTSVSAPLELISDSAFSFLYGCLVLFAFGPGCISLDALVKRFVYHEKT